MKENKMPKGMKRTNPPAIPPSKRRACVCLFQRAEETMSVKEAMKALVKTGRYEIIHTNGFAEIRIKAK